MRASRLNLGLLLKCAVIVIFFVFRGVSAQDNSGLAQGSYSIGTIAIYVGLPILVLPRLFARTSYSLTGPIGYLFLLGVWFSLAVANTYMSALAFDPLHIVLEFAGDLMLVLMVFVGFATRKELQWSVEAIILAGLLTSCVAIYTYFTQGLELFRYSALGASGATYNTVAYLVAAAAWAGPICGLAWRKGIGLLTRMYFVGTLVLLAACLLLTGSRGAVLALLSASGMSLLAAKGVLGRRAVAIMTIGFALAACGAFLAEAHSVRRLVETAKSGGHLGYARDARGEMFLDALDCVFSSGEAVLLGIGVGQYRYYETTYEIDYPHNLFLDLALNAGVPAALLMAVALLHVFRSLMRLNRGSATDASRCLYLQLLGIGVVSLVGGLVCFQFTSNLQLWIFLALGARATLIGRPAQCEPNSRQVVQIASAV